MAAYYELSEEDLDVSDDDPPSIRASRNPNPLVLSAIISECTRRITNLGANASSFQLVQVNRNFSANTYISGAIHGIYNSPLVAAINARLPENIAILLAAGADPNGILLRDLDEYSVRFIRGRNPEYNTYSYSTCPPRIKAMAAIDNSIGQTAPLTSSELTIRRKGYSRFWSETELPTLRFRSRPARTALEIAAGVGDIAIFDVVRAAGPDESWWFINPTPSQLPDELTHSALSTSSPIHEAILSGKLDMLQHLLSLGFSPNILPLAAPTRCIPPHITAIAFCETPNIEAYNILALHPSINLNLRTPIFSLHVLHFVAARLEISLLQRITNDPRTPLEAAGVTVLGHTLLHIAALPLTDAHINLFSEKIFNSIHDVRTLDTRRWLPINLRRRSPATRGILSSAADTQPLPRAPTLEDEADLQKQAEMVLWLLESNTQNLGAQDVYGNTPLHYVASAMRVNEELLKKMRAWEGGEVVWKGTVNELGYTPEDLWEDGRAVEKEGWKTFWMNG